MPSITSGLRNALRLLAVALTAATLAGCMTNAAYVPCPPAAAVAGAR